MTVDDGFLHELHARFAVDESALDEFVRRAMGSPAVAVHRIVGGYDNEVYRVEFDAGTHVYVRIRQADDDDFDDEVRAMELARSADVPVPAVLTVGTVDPGRPAMIVAPARGRPLTEIPDRRHAMESLGRLLRRLHDISMPGYWRPNHNNQWVGDPLVARRGFVADRAGERDYLLRAGFSHDEIDRMIAAISVPPPSGGPVLVHGDPTAEHVYVDEAGDVVDLIDWGMWCGGWPVDDLAYAIRVYPRAEVDALLAGHGDTLADPMFRQLIWRTAIGQGIGHLAHHLRIGDTAGAERNARGLVEALTELSD